jgi:lipoprotein-anchoring transpeptidase ErfK/SrfK
MVLVTADRKPVPAARHRRAATLLASIAVVVATPALPAVAQTLATTPTTPTTPSATTPESTTPPATTPAVEEPAGIVPAAPTRKASYAARLVVPVVARSRPSSQSRKVARLAPYGSWNGGPVVLQIAEVRMVKGRRWVRVRLPIRPNGSTGWLAESHVEVSKLRYRITISRRLHRLTLLRDGRSVGSTRVVIGAPGTPTPRGDFAVLEVVKGEVIGPWALHLTAHSNVLDNYGGGPGRVALHGRSGALLNDPLGSSRSHGCVRMSNAFVTRLAKVAVEGTPVRIR